MEILHQHMSCHQVSRVATPWRQCARLRWLPMRFYGRGSRSHSEVLHDAAFVAVGGETGLLSTFSKISRRQFRRHRALLISAIDNLR